MTPDPISADLKAVLRRLKLSRLLDTLPERLTLARQQKMPPQDFLLLVLADEVTRRDGLAATRAIKKACPTTSVWARATPSATSPVAAATRSSRCGPISCSRPSSTPA